MFSFKEYQYTLKNKEKEEYLDLYLFRPIAYLIVKFLYHLPLTPNHYSLFALICGILATIEMTKNHGLNSVLLITVFCTLDCCDGMQARLKKNGTQHGKLIDGIVDYSVNIILHGTYLKMLFINQTNSILPYLFFGAASFKILHSLIYDLFIDSLPDYSNLANSGESKLKTYLQARALLSNWLPKKSYLLFRLTGPTTHLIVFILSSAIKLPIVYIFYSLFFCNLIILTSSSISSPNQK